MAHRYSYFLETEIDPQDQQVCHRCDNPLCVRPDHLFLGTAKDNMADMIAKERHRTANRTGSNNNRAKLSEADVDQIRTLIGQGFHNTAIAGIFGVHHSLISRIRLGKSWTGPRKRADRNVPAADAAIGERYGSLFVPKVPTSDAASEAPSS